MPLRKPARFLDRATPPHIVTLVLLAGLSAATMNIYLPSLTNMAEDFQTDYRLMQLSVALYLGANAVLHTLIGPLSDRYGRRPILLGALLLFCVFTIGIIFAQTVETFLLLRTGQAAVVAGIVISRAAVRDMYSESESASMIGYVTMGMALVPMVSPAFGGFLDQAFGWQANFWVLLFLGIGVALLVWFDLGETAERREGGFAAQMRETPELFMSPRFWGYVLTATLASGAFFAYLGGAPYVGTEVFGLTPAKLGLFFGSPAIGYMAGNAISGAFSVRIGINRMILIGSLINTVGLLISLLFSLSGLGSIWTFFGFMTFVGLGNGMVLPNATAGSLSVRPKLAGTASGIGGAIMIGGGALIAAFAGFVLRPGSGASPLIWLMFVTSVLAVFCILFVIRRANQLGIQD